MPVVGRREPTGPSARTAPLRVMAEVPSVVHWLPEDVGMGIDGVSIGSNDLTQLLLGVDRNSDVCAELFDEADPALLDAIAQAIEKANRLGITSSLCGQAPSTNPAFTEHLREPGPFARGDLAGITLLPEPHWPPAVTTETEDTPTEPKRRRRRSGHQAKGFGFPRAGSGPNLNRRPVISKAITRT
jgi:hypothetical protein